MAQSGQSEFVIRVPRKNDNKKYSVLKFNKADCIDTAEWNAESQVRLERTDNKNIVQSSVAVQEFGEGSEYGKAAREEARRKKYGRSHRQYHLDHQPWNLVFKDKQTRERRMRSIREGDSHSDFWIFQKEGNDLIAYKVDEVHKFLPAIKHKTLDIDEAEEKFAQRNRVMNQFALKAQIMSMKNGDEDGEQMLDMKNRLLKIKDGYSSDSEAEGGDDEEGEGTKKPKKKKSTKQRKDKRQRVENADEVAKYESSDGEDEGREYDYMSDSGSDSDREEVKLDEKMDKELVGVGDESGLKKSLDSDEESTDSEAEELTKRLLKQEGERKRDNIDIEERDSSGSDSEDPDKEKINSVVFLQKKEVNEPNGLKRPATGSEGGNDAKRSRIDGESSGAPGPSTSAPAVPDGLNEETVRKYLRRKPHTTKELISKIKSKCPDMDKNLMVSQLAAILKAIGPSQFRQKQGRKEVLFFSLSNTVE